MSKLLARWLGVRRNRMGQTTAEYAIIAALVAISSIAIILIFGTQIREIFSASAKQLSGDSAAQVGNKTGGADTAVDKGPFKF